MTKSTTKIKSRKSPSESSGLDRRSFFKGATLGISAGIAATALGTGEAAAASATETNENKSHYRLTDHVQRVYALARF